MALGAGTTLDFPLSSLCCFALGLDCSFSRVEVIESLLLFSFIMLISTVHIKEQHIPSLSSFSPWLVTLCCFGSFGKSSFGKDSPCTSALSV